MNFIYAKDLKEWSKIYPQDCRKYFPELIERLCIETNQKLSEIKFLYGDNSDHSGYDGIVTASEVSDYIPKGDSVWETGTDATYKTKAQKDYNTRTKNPLDKDPFKTVFIFITNQIWESNKGKNSKTIWLKKQNGENIWKEVRVYDAIDLEKWLRSAPTTALWLAKLLKKYPATNVQAADLFWDEWSKSSKIEFTSSLVLAGRKKQFNIFSKWLEGTPSDFKIKSTTKEEAIAFVCACIIEIKKNGNNYFNKTIIVSGKEEFRSIINSHSKHIIINNFSDRSLIDYAVSKNNYVIIPLSPEDSTEKNDIELEALGRNELIEELKKLKFSDEEANKYSKESGRSLSVLRRLFTDNKNKPIWEKPENARELIPVLLVQKWNESNENDKKILEILSGKSYREFSEILIKYKNSADPPVINIDNMWRLTSPMDSWSILSYYLSDSDMKVLEEVIFLVLEEPDPEFELDEDERYRASFLGKVKKYSIWLTEGLLHTLILLSLRGKRGKEIEKSQNFVTNIMFRLLNNANELRWFSLANFLPLIAETSPDLFLKFVENSLSDPEPKIKILFREGKDKLFSRCNFSGLLWALESLAWNPGFLPRVTIVLAKMIKLYEKGNWSNTPLATLEHIYLPWLPQTIASLDERLQSIDLLIKNDSVNALKLLFKMLPTPHGIGHFTQKFRWRIFGKLKNERITYLEIFKTHSEILNRILVLLETEPSLIPKLISFYNHFNNDVDKKKIYNFIDLYISKHHKYINEIRESLAKLISRHTQYSDSEWAMNKDEVDKLQVLYDKIEISDVSNRYKWLFDDHYPPLIGVEKMDYKEMEKRIDEERILAIQKIFKEKGFGEVIAMIKKVKLPFFLGWALANIPLNETEEKNVINLLSNDDSCLNFTRGYIFYSERNKGLLWLDKIVDFFISEKIDKKIILNFLLILNHSRYIWDLVNKFDTEIISEYWTKCSGLYGKYSETDKKYFYENMLNYKRFSVAVDTISIYPENVSNDIIVQSLIGLATDENKSTLNGRLEVHHIISLFRLLDQRKYEDEETFETLEILYSSILEDSTWGRPPKFLNKRISRDPNFFVDLIKMVYRPKNEDLEKNEAENLTSEQIEKRAGNVYRLLYSWEKMGFDFSESTKETISEWIVKAQALAIVYDREGVVNSYIGKILASTYLKNDQSKFDIVCELYENFFGERIEEGFYYRIIDSRGMTTRSPFEGGMQERDLANHYKKIADDLKFKFPKVSVVFERLVKNYEYDALNEDREAKQDESEY